MAVTTSSGWEVVVEGIDFGEGPRWHDGRLWFSDFFQGTISSVGDDGVRHVEHRHQGRPSGLGWLPDGRLVFVSMLDRRLLRVEPDGTTVVHADLAAVAGGHCNDMVIGADGTAYVGNFGFDFEGDAEPVTTRLAVVRSDGSVTTAPGELTFPNGSVITPDGGTLIVGESFGARYTAFTIDAGGGLTAPRTWADVPGTTPDGCTLDADGAIWFADARGRQVVRVAEGGDVLAHLPTPDPTFACMLGGTDGRTLFVLTAAGAHPDVVAGRGTGRLLARRVDVGRAAGSRP